MRSGARLCGQILGRASVPEHRLRIGVPYAVAFVSRGRPVFLALAAEPRGRTPAVLGGWLVDVRAVGAGPVVLVLGEGVPAPGAAAWSPIVADIHGLGLAADPYHGATRPRLGTVSVRLVG